MRNSRKKRGFTLVEVMVFSVVSLVFIGLLAQFFITAAKRTEDSRLRVDLQQSAVLILKKFGRDLERSSSRSMAASDSPLYVLSMTRASSWTAVPGIQWEQRQYLWVYNSTKKTLHREVYPPESPAYSEPLSQTKPYLPTAAELQAVASTSSGKERKLSSYIEEFSLEDRNGSKTQFQTQPLALQMKLKRPLSSSQRFAQFTVKRWYTLRNSF